MNLLVKLSRNTKVMVPLVIVVGIAIFAGGALVNKQQKIARQNETEQQINQVAEQTNQIAQQDDNTVTTEESLPEEPSADGGATTEPSEVAVEPTVVENIDGTVTVVAKLSTIEAGTCTTVIQDTHFTAVAKDGACEFKDLSVPVDVKQLKITFEADESSQTGTSSTQVQ